MKMLPLLCTASVVRNLLNNEVGSCPARAIDASKPMQWQDRRPIKPQPASVERDGDFIWMEWPKGQKKGIAGIKRLWGLWTPQPLCVGQIIYVRETFGLACNVNDRKDWLEGIPHIDAKDFPENAFPKQGADALIWEATSGSFEWCDDDGGHTDKSSWKPSIHMPKWASRIHLEVMRVRVERACDISEEDANAEGCSHIVKERQFPVTKKEAFKFLWESLYPGKWNAFCWVYDLRRIK